MRLFNKKIKNYLNLKTILKLLLKKMGNSESINNYSNTELKLENNIREYELEIGFYSNSFSKIYNKLFLKVESDNIENKYNYYRNEKNINLKNNFIEIKKANKILLEFFSYKIINLLDNQYFKTKDHKYYNSEKLIIFIFLITNDSTIKDSDNCRYFQDKVNLN